MTIEITANSGCLLSSHQFDYGPGVFRVIELGSWALLARENGLSDIVNERR